MSQRDADRPRVTPVPSPDSDPSPQLLVSRQDTGPPVFTSVTRCLLQTSQLLGTWATRPSGTFGNDENVLFPALSSLAAAGHVEPPSRESSCDRELKPTLRLPATAARGRWLRGQTHNSRCHSSRADDSGREKQGPAVARTPRPPALPVEPGFGLTGRTLTCLPLPRARLCHDRPLRAQSQVVTARGTCPPRPWLAFHTATGLRMVFTFLNTCEKQKQEATSHRNYVAHEG